MVKERKNEKVPVFTSSLIQRLGFSTHSHRRCPYCHSHGLYRENRKGLVWGLSVVGLRPYRCLDCDRVHLGFWTGTEVHGGDR
jgi:hypothetical protein